MQTKSQFRKTGGRGVEWGLTLARKGPDLKKKNDFPSRWKSKNGKEKKRKKEEARPQKYKGAERGPFLG